MKKIISILAFAAICMGSSAQSAIRQLENMTGASLSRNWGSGSYESMRSGASSGFDGGGGLADAWLDAIEGFGEVRAEQWEARKAAREAARAERKERLSYVRTSFHKLKDYKPVDPRAGKTLPAGMGSTGDYSVYAKYNRKGEAKYGIWNNSKGKWQRKPEFSGIMIVGPNAAAASLKGKAGIIDPKTGDVVVDFEYDRYQGFHYPESAENTLIALCKTSPEGKEMWYVMQADANGNYIQRGKPCDQVYFFEDGTGRKLMYRDADSGKVGLLDEKGNELLQPVYSGLKNLKYNYEDAAIYQASSTDSGGNKHFGVIDEYGRSVVPCIFDKVEPSGDGKFGIQVMLNGRYGWYDNNGREIMPTGFDRLELDHFWDGNKHRAFFRGSFTGEDGVSYMALYDTSGAQLTDFSSGTISFTAIKEFAHRLEEYRIY